MRNFMSAGMTVFVPGMSGESLAFYDCLRAEPTRAASVTFVGVHFPGVNRSDYLALHPSARQRAYFMSEAVRTGIGAGRADLVPLDYPGIVRDLEQNVRIDVAIAQVAPPDHTGRCSLGASYDFLPSVWHRAGMRVAHVNPRLPRTRGSFHVHLDDCQLTFESACDIPSLPAEISDAATLAHARRVAELIGDGATLQFGVGRLQAALLMSLENHRRLRVYSGMVSPAILRLLETGAIQAEGAIECGVALGDAGFYARLDADPRFYFRPARETHDIRRIAAIPDFCAVNSALQVDLFGQVNVDWLHGRLVAGAGGLPAFSTGARLSPGGRSIIVSPRHGRWWTREPHRLQVRWPRTQRTRASRSRPGGDRIRSRTAAKSVAAPAGRCADCDRRARVSGRPGKGVARCCSSIVTGVQAFSAATGGDARGARATRRNRAMNATLTFDSGAAIVFGGSGGIGEGIARRFAAAGMPVVITYFSNEATAARIKAEIDSAGGRSDCRRLDLTHSQEVDNLFAAVKKEHERIGHVIYAAGPSVDFAFIGSIADEQWRHVIECDLNGAFYVIQNAVRAFRAQGGGNLVAVITAAVERVPLKDAMSAAPKAAIEMLVHGVAKEAGRFGIRANCVAPGWINAGLGKKSLEQVLDEKTREATRRKTPLQRFGAADDIAWTALFLCSQQASFITGQSVAVDGGLQL